MNMEDNKDSKSISRVESFWDKNIKIHSDSTKIVGWTHQSYFMNA